MVYSNIKSKVGSYSARDETIKLFCIHLPCHPHKQLYLLLSLVPSKYQTILCIFFWYIFLRYDFLPFSLLGSGDWGLGG